MSLERSHDALRPTLPRASDLPADFPARDPSAGRDASGRFASGNGIGRGRHWVRTIARSLGVELAGEAGELGREAWVLYTAFLRELPTDCASVRQLVAARARAAVLSARYARRAAELGLDTPEGAEAIQRATSLDQRAERLAVTSLDIATRLAASSRRSQVIDLGRVIAEAAKPRDRSAP